MAGILGFRADRISCACSRNVAIYELQPNEKKNVTQEILAIVLSFTVVLVYFFVFFFSLKEGVASYPIQRYLLLL